MEKKTPGNRRSHNLHGRPGGKKNILKSEGTVYDALTGTGDPRTRPCTRRWWLNTRLYLNLSLAEHSRWWWWCFDFLFKDVGCFKCTLDCHEEIHTGLMNTMGAPGASMFLNQLWIIPTGILTDLTTHPPVQFLPVTGWLNLFFPILKHIIFYKQQKNM